MLWAARKEPDRGSNMAPLQTGWLSSSKGTGRERKAKGQIALAHRASPQGKVLCWWDTARARGGWPGIFRSLRSHSENVGGAVCGHSFTTKPHSALSSDPHQQESLCQPGTKRLKTETLQVEVTKWVIVRMCVHTHVRAPPLACTPERESCVEPGLGFKAVWY